VTRAAVIGVAYYALIPTVVGFFLWYEGAVRTSAGEAALFTAVLPVSALILAALLLGEPITARQAGGCGCVIAAILIGVGRRPRGTRTINARNCK
jgi:drug/metabolite transporter (DMT)-like permease